MRQCLCAAMASGYYMLSRKGLEKLPIWLPYSVENDLHDKLEGRAWFYVSDKPDHV